MYRVLFRLIKISIHIKETLSLQFSFRKGTDSIVGKDLYPLVDGVSNIKTTTEFLISKLDPAFELHVNFTFKKVKKQAGFIQINLKDLTEGGSYQEIRTLQNAPGGKAFVEFGFIYFDSGVSSLSKSLESFEVFERQMNEEYKQKILEQNVVLGGKLKELTNLKTSLTDLNQNYTRSKTQFSKVQAEFDEEVSEEEKKMDEVNYMLKEEQEKEVFLRELVEKSGSQDLRDYIREINQAEMKMEEEGNFEG